MNLLDSHDMPRFLSFASGDKDSLKLAWLFITDIVGAPCIYYAMTRSVWMVSTIHFVESHSWDEHKWDKDLLGYFKEIIALRTK